MTWKTNITDNVKYKGILFSTIDNFLAGKGEMEYKEYKNAIAQLSRNAPNNFTDSGKIIRVKCMELKKCQSNSQPKSMLQINKFLKTFQHIIEQNPQWEETVEVDIILEKTRMLWVVLAHKIAASARFLSDNVNVLGNRMFSRIASKTDAWIRNNYGNSIIDKTDEDAADQLCLYFT